MSLLEKACGMEAVLLGEKMSSRILVTRCFYKYVESTIKTVLFCCMLVFHAVPCYKFSLTLCFHGPLMWPLFTAYSTSYLRL